MSSLPHNFLSEPDALIQEGRSGLKARNLFLARKIASRLFNNRGEIDEAVLHEIINRLQEHLYGVLPSHIDDAPMREWMLAALKEIARSSVLREKINAFYRPIKSPYGDELLQLTLDVKEIQDVQAKQAAVICLLTYLRQNVGSCFATAPAILILSEKRELFLDDLNRLLQTGRLNRVVAGKEYAVPLSPNWGQKKTFAYKEENALLRSWEYTLASFAEAKAEFVAWNLYHSLGVDTEERHGIGAICFRFLGEKVETLNREAADHQGHYERLFLEAKALESKATRSSSQNEVDWTLLEYRGRKAEIDAVLGLRDEAIHKAERLAKLYPILIETYSELFPRYFQEVYDAQMRLGTALFLDDSPAGFRLLFKHGRENPAAWTFIYDANQFTDSLTQFFSMTEILLFEKEAFEGLERELGELISQIIQEVRTTAFLEEAMRRVSKAHGIELKGNVLENIDKIEKKPWEYTSGGNLSALLFVLYGFEHKPREKAVESPQDLLTFLIETLKDAPADLTSLFIEDSSRLVLSSSPTHAFLLKPGLEEFKQCWNNSLYTFTWVRDNLVVPRKNFFELIRLENQEIDYLVSSCKGLEPFGDLKKELLARLSGPLNGFELAEKASAFLPKEVMALFESHLYSSLPLFPSSSLEERVNRLLAVMGLQYEVVLQERREPFFSAQDLRVTLLESLAAAEKKIFFPTDFVLLAAKAMEKEGYSSPRALVIADTNWLHEFFAFQVSPETGHLELVLSNYSGSLSKPLHQWKEHLEKRALWNFFL